MTKKIISSNNGRKPVRFGLATLALTLRVNIPKTLCEKTLRKDIRNEVFYLTVLPHYTKKPSFCKVYLSMFSNVRIQLRKEVFCHVYFSLKTFKRKRLSYLQQASGTQSRGKRIYHPLPAHFYARILRKSR